MADEKNHGGMRVDVELVRQLAALLDDSNLSEIERARPVLEHPRDIVQRVRPVDFGLAQALQVEVGAVEDVDGIGHFGLSIVSSGSYLPVQNDKG